MLWVNTHGSILLGLLVVAVERDGRWCHSTSSRWSGECASRGFTARSGSVGGERLAASCLTPYGPGLLAYDVGVAHNTQIAQYIEEWNSPNFHSFMTLLVFCVPLAVLVVCLRNRRIPVLEASLAALLFVGALRTAADWAVYLMLVAVGLAASLPARPAWGDLRHGAGPAPAWSCSPSSSWPCPPCRAGTVEPTQPVQAFDLPECPARADRHRVHVG